MKVSPRSILGFTLKEIDHKIALAETECLQAQAECRKKVEALEQAKRELLDAQDAALRAAAERKLRQHHGNGTGRRTTSTIHAN